MKVSLRKLLNSKYINKYFNKRASLTKYLKVKLKVIRISRKLNKSNKISYNYQSLHLKDFVQKLNLSLNLLNLPNS